MHTYHLIPKSSNAKTGAIPVSTTSRESCPDACPLKQNGCYAENAPLVFHWNAVSRGERGTSLAEFTRKIDALPDGQLWRHNQAGDLPGDRKRIDGAALARIVAANHNKRGFTYTHYSPFEGSNAKFIKNANKHGFTVNLSADNLAEADQFAALGIAPVTVVLPIDAKETLKTPQGRTVCICPATQRDDVTCESCKLCSLQSHNIVGFPAHGGSKKKAELISIGGAR